MADYVAAVEVPMAVDVRTARFVTVEYPHLQGLRLVPLGLAFLVSAAFRAGWLPTLPWVAGRGAQVSFFGLLAIAVVAALPIGNWYAHRYGVVRLRLADNGALALVSFVVCLLALVGLEEWLHSSIPLARLFLVSGLLVLGTAYGCKRVHYLMLAAICLTVPWMLPQHMAPASRALVLDLLTGGGLLIAGIGDHLVLTRFLVRER
jgi:hypothetical protein